jgi:hypothetical protein
MITKGVDFAYCCQKGWPGQILDNNFGQFWNERGGISFRGRVTRIRIFGKKISGFQNRDHRVFQIVHFQKMSTSLGCVRKRENERERREREFTSRISVKTTVYIINSMEDE